MSAFGGKADVNQGVGECPLIAISGHPKHRKILLLELSQEHLDLLRRELVLKERVATFRDIEGKRVRPTTDAAQAITPFPIEFADQVQNRFRSGCQPFFAVIGEDNFGLGPRARVIGDSPATFALSNQENP